MIDCFGFGLIDDLVEKLDWFVIGVEDVVMVCDVFGLEKIYVIMCGGVFYVLVLV